MALPSQGGNSNRGMYRRHSARKGITWFIVIGIAAGGTWALWPSNTSSEPTEETLQVPKPEQAKTSRSFRKSLR